MTVRISATVLLASLDDISRCVRRGGRFTVTYRGRAAFHVVPLGNAEVSRRRLEQDSLYQAGPVGASRPLRRP